jgi:hypothetical protein
MANPTFLKLLDDIRSTHERKNADYTGNSNPYENFERAAVIVSWFKDPVDQVFAALIGVKLARIANLRSKEGTPNNESIEDSHLDQTVYSGIWASWRKDQAAKETVPQASMSAALNPEMVPTERLGRYQCIHCNTYFDHEPRFTFHAADLLCFCSKQCQSNYLTTK